MEKVVKVIFIPVDDCSEEVLKWATDNAEVIVGAVTSGQRLETILFKNEYSLDDSSEEESEEHSEEPSEEESERDVIKVKVLVDTSPAALGLPRAWGDRIIVFVSDDAMYVSLGGYICPVIDLDRENAGDEYEPAGYL